MGMPPCIPTVCGMGGIPGSNGGGIVTAGGAFMTPLIPLAAIEVANIVFGVFCTPVPNSPVLGDKNSR